MSHGLGVRMTKLSQLTKTGVSIVSLMCFLKYHTHMPHNYRWKIIYVCMQSSFKLSKLKYHNHTVYSGLITSQSKDG